MPDNGKAAPGRAAGRDHDEENGQPQGSPPTGPPSRPEPTSQEDAAKPLTAATPADLDTEGSAGTALRSPKASLGAPGGPTAEAPPRIGPQIKRVGRLRCQVCYTRWPAYERADLELPTACPACRLFTVHGFEPVDQRWWAHITGIGEDAVEQMILAETGRLPPAPPEPTPTTKPPPRTPKPPKPNRQSPPTDKPAWKGVRV